MQERPRAGEGRRLHGIGLPPVGADAAETDAPRGQPLIGVVGAQRQAIFGARGEHAVGLAHPLHHQIVDHHADIGVRAAQDDGVLGAGAQRGIEPRDKALRGRLLVARGPIDLPGEEKPANFFCLQARAQGTRVDEIIFDRIARPQHPDLGKTGNGVEELLLDILRQRGRNAVWIDGGVVQSFRFEENLMCLALLEPNHLVLDRRAIAWPPTRNRAGIDRRLP